MKAFITGGGGFVGKEIVRQLLERGDEVVSLQRSESPELIEMGARCVRGDITDSGAVVEAMAGADCTFHVAAKVGFSPSAEPFERINVGGTQNVLDACQANGVARLVFCSSPSVAHAESGENVDESVGYAPTFKGHYPRTKAEAEQLVLAANGTSLAGGGTLLTTAVRPHLVIGPGDQGAFPRAISRAKSGRFRIIGDGTNRVDLTALENAGAAHVLAADALASDGPACAGKAYFITNGEPVVLWPWLNDVFEQVGVPRIEKRISEGTARFVGRALEGTWSLLGKSSEPPVTEYMALMLAGSHTFNIDAARRDLGYEPKVSLASAVERLVPWLKDELAAGRL